MKNKSHLVFIVVIVTVMLLLINNLFFLQLIKQVETESLSIWILLLTIVILFWLVSLILSYEMKGSDKEAQLAEEKEAMRKALALAIQREEIEVVYQPIVNLKNGSTGLEALARWKYNGQWISPVVFVPLIEELEMMEEFTIVIVDHILSDWCFWKEELPSLNRVAINVSPSLFSKAENTFLKYLLTQMNKNQIDPKQLCLEITEDTLVDQNTLTFLEDSIKHGFEVAIDDFGTGYSSMHYIANYPFTILKIDKAFIEELEANAKQQAVVQAIIQLAKQLNVQVVAEGVEKRGQLKILQKMGVDAVQGYYFSKPQFVSEWNSQLLNKKLLNL